MKTRLILLALAVVVGSTLAEAAKPGALDKSFSNNGTVTRKTSTGRDAGFDVDVMGNGKVVVVGLSYNPTFADDDFFVARFRPNGAPDDSFDGDGLMKMDISNNDDYLTAVQVLRNGKIVAAGASDGGVDDDVLVVRLKPNGALDPGFGAGLGYVEIDLGGLDFANDVAIQDNGKIVYGGASDTSDFDAAVGRLDKDGTPDNGFSGDGETVFAAPGEEFINAVASIDGNRVLAAGRGFDSSFDFGDWIFHRYESDGDDDTSFGSGGKRTVSFPGQDDNVRGLAVRSNGSYIACGHATASSTNQDLAVARFKKNGKFDRKFGKKGKVLVELGSDDDDQATDCALQKNGKIVTSGMDDGDDGNMVIARFRASGGLDRSFGKGGLVRPPFPLSSEAYGVDPRGGKIVVAGTAEDAPSTPGDKDDLAVVRLHQ